MSQPSRYPRNQRLRLIPSFVEGPSAKSAALPRGDSRPATSTDDAASKVKARLQGLIKPFRPEQLANTVHDLLEQKRYRLLPALDRKSAGEWHSFNGITGSWLPCQCERVAEAVREALRQHTATVLRKLDRIEKKVASSPEDSTKEEMMQLLLQHREWLCSRSAELAGPTTAAAIQKALASHPLAPLRAPTQDAFASNQGCFEVKEGRSWRHLGDEEAAARMQTTFVTGQIPLSPGSGEAPTTEELSLFCRVLGHALYRNRHHPDGVVVQIVGERVEEARRKILALTGGYVELLDSSTIAFSDRRIQLSPHARLVLLDLHDVSYRTATRAVRRLLAHGRRVLPISFAYEDLTPLRLPRGTKLLYVSAADIVGSIGHEALLAAAVAPKQLGTVPSAADVRKCLLRRVLQSWLEEQHITSHQHDMDPPQEQHTMPLKEVVKQLKRSSCAAAFCSLAPTQRELSVELERLGFAITNHSNTMMVKMWHLHKQEPLNYSHNVSG